MEYTIDRGMRVVPEAVWRPILRRASAALGAGALAESQAVCLSLLAVHGLPRAIRELVYWIQAESARPLAELVSTATVHPISWTLPSGAVGRDPSPLVMSDHIVVYGRAAPLTADGQPAAHDDLLLTLDEELAVANVTTLRDETGMAGRFDDVRPFLGGGLPHAAFLLFEADAGEWTRAGYVEIADGAYRQPRLYGPRADHFRQGWAPIMTEPVPHFIAWWEPTEILRFEDASESFAQASLRLASHVAQRFWTGSQGVPVPGGYLLLINETIPLENGDEINLSRLARLDHRFQLADISPQFFLADPGHDVATGLALRHGQLIAGFTAGEERAVLVTMTLAEALATLQPVPAPGRQH